MEGPKYADRFREHTSGAEVLAGDEGRAPREWPRWLTRGAAGVAVVGAVVLAMTTSGGDEEPARDASERVPAAASTRTTAPPDADITVTSTGTDVWETRGFSYDVEFANPTTTALEIIDIGEVLAGTEMVWNGPVLLPAQGAASMRVDFLVLNCRAVINQPAPDELRLVLRPEDADLGSAGAVQLFRLDLDDASAAIEAAGGVRCSQEGPPVVPNTMQ